MGCWDRWIDGADGLMGECHRLVELGEEEGVSRAAVSCQRMAQKEGEGRGCREVTEKGGKGGKGGGGLPCAAVSVKQWQK